MLGYVHRFFAHHELHFIVVLLQIFFDLFIWFLTITPMFFSESNKRIACAFSEAREHWHFAIVLIVVFLNR